MRTQKPLTLSLSLYYTVILTFPHSDLSFFQPHRQIPFLIITSLSFVCVCVRVSIYAPVIYTANGEFSLKNIHREAVKAQSRKNNNYGLIIQTETRNYGVENIK